MLNNSTLMGRLTADPELRQTQNGISVATFTLAVERNFKDGSGQRETDFLPIVVWRGTAEFVDKYFRKGQLVAVQGSIQTRKYEDKNGNKRTATEIVADRVFFAEAKQQTAPQFQAPPPAQPPVRTQASVQQRFRSDTTEGFEEIGDDDLPF